ncbi:MAG: MerR family transcriptional regulator [Hyphomonadaceae bacterium]
METKFEELSPFKRADGRRYYRSEDMETLRTLQRLLHVDGLTIKGAQRVLAGGEAGEGDEAESGSDETGVSVRDLQAAVSRAVAAAISTGRANRRPTLRRASVCSPCWPR